jgi:hypothetical protein
MNNKLNKSIVIISILLFIIPTIGSAYTINNSKNTKIFEEYQQKSLTIYRVAPNGSITTIKLNIAEKTDDIEKYLEFKCSELFEKDLEMQNLVQKLQQEEVKNKNLTDNLEVLSSIKSRGRGFHIKTKLGFNFFNSQLRLLRIFLATFIITPKKGLVVGIYNDENAETSFHPIGKPDLITNLTGNHTIIVGGFYGYTTWIGRYSCLLSMILLQREIIPRSFKGVGTLVYYNQSE